MSRVIVDSSSEDETVRARSPSPPPLPPKKRRRAAAAAAADGAAAAEPVAGPSVRVEAPAAWAASSAAAATEQLRQAGLPGSVSAVTFCGQRIEVDAQGKVSYTPDEKLLKAMKGGFGAQSEEKKPKRPTSLALKSKNQPAPAAPLGQEAAWQRGMELALSLLLPLKVDHKELTLLPDGGTLECFRRAVQAYLSETRTFLPMTFTSNNSFRHLTARFLLDMVTKEAGLAGENANVSGCVVWQHGCEETLHCLHGLPMIQKESLIELDINSENAQRVLKETPERARVTPNRWGRNVVQLRNEEAFCCPHDVNMVGNNNFSGKSCGMAYTEGGKALMAFRQAMAFQTASYPKMAHSRSHLLIPLKCECNWNSHLPVLGRQVCKVTPFAIQATSHVDRSLVDDPKMLATLENPAMLVFQCCNPVYRNSKANPQKNCDMKISVVDVMTSLQIAKKMWLQYVKSTPPTRFPEFKWGPEYQVQNTILPQGAGDADDSLF